jgi:hypothetical protein
VRCGQCGKSMPDDALQCESCGTKSERGALHDRLAGAVAIETESLPPPVAPTEPQVPEQPLAQPPPRVRTRRVEIGVIAALAIALIASIAYNISSHKEATTAIEAHLQTIALQQRQTEALDSVARRVDKFNRDFGAQLGRIEVNNLESSVKGIETKGHLPEDAKKTLDEFERSIADIGAMTTKLKEYERYLGAPMTVQRGQTHADLAQEYLVNQAHVTPEEAAAVVKRTALDWDIEPGNLVFNLYHDGILLSTVTQGTAKHSPLALQAAARRRTAKE